MAPASGALGLFFVTFITSLFITAKGTGNDPELHQLLSGKLHVVRAHVGKAFSGRKERLHVRAEAGVRAPRRRGQGRRAARSGAVHTAFLSRLYILEQFWAHGALSRKYSEFPYPPCIR